jgi:heptose-I-phosphate ethanolaminephosphotransferase
MILDALPLRATATVEDAWRWVSKRRQVLWVVALNAFLLSPLLFDLGVSRTGDEGVDKIVLFAVPASLAALLTVQLLVKRLYLCHLLLFPFYCFVGADLYLISQYGLRLTSSTIAVALENIGQAIDFVRAEKRTIATWTAALLGFYLIALYKVRHVQLNASRRLKAIALGALFLVYGGLTVQRCIVLRSVKFGVLDVASHDRGSPFGVVPQSYVAYIVYRDVLEHTQAAADFRFGATRDFVPKERETYVLVIGESSRPDHWGLYGYPRNTTPRLARERNLVVFEDAVTQAALTSVSVPLILTRGSITSDKQFLTERSIISAYREAGFFTSWLSTQQRDHWTGAVNRYSGEAHRHFFEERRHDGVLARTLTNVLGAQPDDTKQFVVIHTQGSHFVFADRYPEAKAVFPAKGPGMTRREHLVNTYDNSIVYTDFVLAELIQRLAALKSPAALLYISDHGENLEDDERNIFGHYFNNEYDLPIPMVLWYSDEYAALFPEKINTAKQNASRPVSTRNAFYTLAGLGGLKFPDPNLAKLNLVAPEWQPTQRHVKAHTSPWVDFDREFGALRKVPAGKVVRACD